MCPSHSWKSWGMRSLQTCGGPIDDIRRHLTYPLTHVWPNGPVIYTTISNIQTGLRCFYRPHSVWRKDLFILNATQVGLEDTSWPSPFCPKSAPWHCPGESDHPARRRQCTSGPGDHQSLSLSMRDLKTSWLMWTRVQNRTTDLEREASLFLKHTEGPMLVTAEE